MTTYEKEDIALTALLKTAQNHTDLGLNELLIKAYEIERRHQFDADEQRDSSIQEMQKLFEAFIDSSGKNV